MALSNSLNPIPAGTIIDHAGTVAPPGFLACPLVATTVSRVTYAALFLAIGTTWGAGDGSTTFGIPFFAADQVGIQASGNVGSNSTGAVVSHVHQEQYATSGAVVPAQTIQSTGGAGVTTILGAATGSPYLATGALNTVATGGAANLAAGQRVLKCVKY